MINGRAAPDTMHAAFAPWLPNQPYNAMPMQHPGEKLLLRFVGGNREPHPFHVHGQHARVLARDGRPYASVEGGAIDLSQAQFSITVAPGETTDAIFSWAGTGLGWDIYGHAPGDPMLPGELASDHGKPIPVVVPSDLDLAIGEFWSGSPYLGKTGGLAPGLGVQSEEGSYTFMWHSHSEKEMTNNNVFPGGMMTMLMIMSPDVMIME
jgi:FtsP/CotA-like multicopper oxidase with cupredoxin domain